MVNEPNILILMATYNGEKFIKDQINSILNQTYKNWKLIIHDDGSTDTTVDIIKHYVEKFPQKIHLIEDGIKFGSAKDNFNHLIKIVKERFEFEFDYIMFSDQDDIWLPNKVEISVNEIINLENKYGNSIPIIVHTDLKVVDENLNIISNSFWEYQKINPHQNSINYLILENIITGNTMIINKYLFNLIKDIPNKAIIHDWWIAIVCSVYNGIIFPINTQTVLYRQHISNDLGAKQYSYKALLYRFMKNPAHFFNKRKLIIDQTLEICKLYQKTNTFIENLRLSFNNPLKRKVFLLKNNCYSGPLLKKLGKFIFI